ncbi:MAG: chemotaxis protein CheW [Bdellovibrio sp.]
MNELQLTTFQVGGLFYGLDVMEVQEITNPMPIAAVPKAPLYIKGLVNLRGQIATAISLGELFKDNKKSDREQMTVVCRVDGELFSFLVDSIGEVIVVNQDSFEPTPDSNRGEARKFMKGVYKTPQGIISLLDVGLIVKNSSEVEA